MSSKISTAQKLLNGVMKYRNTIRKDLVKTFESIHDNPTPKTILFTCFDSRVVASRITQADPGVFYILRNPANLIPNEDQLVKSTPVAEPAALELAFVYNKCHSAVVCGHSDCKALNILFHMRNKEFNRFESKTNSHLSDWLLRYGKDSINKYRELEKNHFEKALTFKKSDNHEFRAYIDPENKFDLHDKFSQINVLEQLKNLRTYKFLGEKINKGIIQSHALWFDVYSGDLYMFSFDEKTFVKVDESSFDSLIKECQMEQLHAS